ncbi:MAG: NAD(P)-binding protein [Acidobacteria bacterium]|nr:NAD(P)-binding protein [Acidobacteriota bacterium]
MGTVARIAVVGGGPAGAACAEALARQRATAVTLFEARDGHEKPCGGGVPSAALREFPALLHEALPRRIVRRLVLISPAGRAVRLEAPEGIHVFRRSELDAFLRARAERAGATLVRARVTGVSPGDPTGWRLDAAGVSSTTFDHIVGADGVNGIVRRAIEPSTTDRELTLALFAYLPSSGEAEMILEFLDRGRGYMWVFPRLDHVSAGICALSGTLTRASMEERLEEFISRRIGGDSRARVRGYFIPSILRPPADARARSIALIGDAGGFVDPLTREGIAHAMRSGVLAAESFERDGTIRTPPLPAELAFAHRYQHPFYRTEFTETMTGLAGRSLALRRVLADLVCGEQSYSKLKRRLLWNAIPCGLEAGWRLATSRRVYLGSPAQ